MVTRDLANCLVYRLQLGQRCQVPLFKKEIQRLLFLKVLMGVGELFVVNRASLRSPSVDFNRIILIS